MVMQSNSDTRSTRQDWLKEGLSVLREAGDGSLTLESLCMRMGKTKGSFYHHFSGRRDFIEQLLSYWEEAFTARFIEDLESLEDSRGRLRGLAERTVREVDARLERTLRFWAERDPAARAAVARVDEAREGYLFEQFEKALGDAQAARVAARVHLAILVGTQTLYQDLSRKELAEHYAYIDRLGLVAGQESRRPKAPEEKP